MATITLYADKLNQMPWLVKNAKKAVTDYKAELFTLKKKVLHVNKDICDLNNIVSSIQASAQTQGEKANALDCLNRKSEQFIADAVRIDNEVADLVRQRKDDFYGKYSYLKPESEKNWFENMLDKAGDWCKKHWKIIGTIVIVLAAVVLVCTGVGGILGAMAVGALLGAGGGGVLGGIISSVTGGSFWEGVESGAFGGAIAGLLSGGMAFVFTGGVAGVSLTLGQTLIIGATSSAASALCCDLGDRFIKGVDISFGEMIINMAFSAVFGAAFAGVFYGLSRGWHALKMRLNSNQGGNRGVVKFTTPKGEPTAENIAQTKAYVKGCNKALKEGLLSPTGRVSTKGSLRNSANYAAKMERAAALAAGKPYHGVAGHVPDTTWTGLAQPPSWLDLSKSVNASLGVQSQKYPIGYQPTKFVFVSPLFNALKFPVTWSAPYGFTLMGIIRD